MAQKYHIYLGLKSGVHIRYGSNSFDIPTPGDKVKYMGWTYDLGWPKKMNTGRVLNKQTPKSLRKSGKARKMLTREIKN